MRKTMKVLHVIPSVSPLRGGPSKAVIEMVKALIEVGVEAEIATTNDNGSKVLNVPLNELSEFHQAPVRFFKRYSPPVNMVREFAYSGDFRHWLKVHISDYDVIHVHAIFSFTSSYAMYLARSRNIPYIIRPIGQLEHWALSQSQWRKQLFLSLFERKNILGASAIQFTADSERQQALTTLPELKRNDRARAIPLGINPSPIRKDASQTIRQRYAIPAGKKVLLYLSRLHKKKGLELIIDALKHTGNEGWYLLIAGDGEPSYVSQIMQKVQQNQLQKRCSFIGFIEGENKQTLLQGADLFALTSYSENFGIAVLEALESGTPVLISKDVALSSVVESEQLGLVCDTNIESIAKALQIGLEDISDLGERARSYVSTNYHWPVIAAQLNALYKELSLSTSSCQT